MAAQRKSALFLLLLFLSVVFLFSLYNSFLPLSSPSLSSLHSPTIFNPLQIPNPNPNPNPNLPNFTLTIKVLAFDRLSSLSRCLHSLSAADYGSDRVNLHIFIDHFKLPPDSTNDKSLNLDRKLNESRQILDFVDGFSWGFGEKMVHYRTGNVGLQAQWLEAWWPSSDHEFAFVVEDDLEVSPLYYRFIRGLILNFYYNASNFSPWIYGASLQRPRFVPGKHGNKIQLDNSTHIFLYQLVGTWGQLLFPRPWKEFRLWYDSHKAKGTKPFLQGMVTTGWYKKMGERIWTPWFIQFIHARGYFNIYTNFLHERALSVSHRDAGVNYGKTAGPDSYLLDDDKSLNFNLLEMHTPLNELKWFDFCFREVRPNRIVRSFKEIESVLLAVQKLNTIILVSLYGSSESETLVRNLLCHFERLNIRNYIFVGPNSSFLLDLARRGHPVIDADQFFDSIRAYISTRSRESNPEMIKEFWVKAFVIKKCLELKYNTWVVGPDMIPVSTDSFLPDSYFDPNTNFYFGEEIYKFLFIRSSSSAREIWDNDDFMFNAALVMNNNNNNYKESGGSSLKGVNFGYTVGKLLEKKGAKKVDEKMLGVNIIISSSSTSSDRTNVNETSLLSLVNGKKLAFWSEETGPGLVQKLLEELGLWIVDGDSSCTAVVCHPS